MKIVTYNVNGLRQRIAQFSSLRKLLDSFDADIICFQETKLRRQELKSDLVMADGYESYFSCTRTTNKGRSGYSGVATFCRVKSAFSSTEVALPVAAEEGFTGVLEASGCRTAEGLEDFAKDELSKIDSEGRCVITDHGHFVLFNIYGPRADHDDAERIQFKQQFYTMLQKRLEGLLRRGRRIFVVGDFNISPAAIDHCDPGPDFEKNEFRRWFRSMLVDSGGSFFDVFRAKHPERRDAYTCWPSNTGAEQFNYGTRIDHIIFAGSCLHQNDTEGHNFITCHVKDCDILGEYKRWKSGETARYRWKGGMGVKLEGSDHAPVCMSLVEVPEVDQHSTPSLASRYLPMIHGLQQTLVSMLMKRDVAKQLKSCEASSSCSAQTTAVEGCSDSVEGTFNNCSYSSLNPEPKGEFSENRENCNVFSDQSPCNTNILKGCNELNDTMPPSDRTKKKPRKTQSSQLSLKSFFQKSPKVSDYVPNSVTDVSLDEADVPKSLPKIPSDSYETLTTDCQSSCPELLEADLSTCSQDRDEKDGNCTLDKQKNSNALLEWRRIQKLMENSIPLCKGHKEPCVARVVKKPGPTCGRRFYVCARAEGPASNPETNCGYFKWASSKPRQA